MSDLALRSAGRRRAWLDEVRATLALSWPIILTNLLQIALTTTDVIMLGRLGPDALAAAVLGATLLFFFVIFGIGVVSAVAPMVARERGIRLYSVREVRRTVRQGLWSVIAIALPVWAILWFAEPIYPRPRPEAGHRGRCRALHVDASMVLPALPRLHRDAQLHRRGRAPDLGTVGRRPSASSPTPSPPGA